LGGVLRIPLFKEGEEKGNSYKEGGILHYFSLPFTRGGRGRGYKRWQCKV